MTKKNPSIKSAQNYNPSNSRYFRENDHFFSSDEQAWDKEEHESEFSNEEDFSMKVVSHMPDLSGMETAKAPQHLSRFDRNTGFLLRFRPISARKWALGFVGFLIIGLVVWCIFPKQENQQDLANQEVQGENSSIFAQDMSPVPVHPVPEPRYPAQDLSYHAEKDKTPPSFGENVFHSGHPILDAPMENHGSGQNTEYAFQNFQTPSEEMSPWGKPVTSDHSHLFTQLQQPENTPQTGNGFHNPNGQLSMPREYSSQTAQNNIPGNLMIPAVPAQQNFQAMPVHEQPPLNFQQPYVDRMAAANSYEQQSSYRNTQSDYSPSMENPSYSVQEYRPQQQPTQNAPNIAMASQYGGFAPDTSQFQSQQQIPQMPASTVPMNQQQLSRNAINQNSLGYPQPQTMIPDAMNVYSAPSAIPATNNFQQQQLPSSPARSYRDTQIPFQSNAVPSSQVFDNTPTTNFSQTSGFGQPMLAQPPNNTQQPQYYLR